MSVQIPSLFIPGSLAPGGAAEGGQETGHPGFRVAFDGLGDRPAVEPRNPVPPWSDELTEMIGHKGQDERAETGNQPVAQPDDSMNPGLGQPLVDVFPIRLTMSGPDQGLSESLPEGSDDHEASTVLTSYRSGTNPASADPPVARVPGLPTESQPVGSGQAVPLGYDRTAGNQPEPAPGPLPGLTFGGPVKDHPSQFPPDRHASLPTATKVPIAWTHLQHNMPLDGYAKAAIRVEHADPTGHVPRPAEFVLSSQQVEPGSTPGLSRPDATLNARFVPVEAAAWGRLAWDLEIPAGKSTIPTVETATPSGKIPFGAVSILPHSEGEGREPKGTFPQRVDSLRGQVAPALDGPRVGPAPLHAGAVSVVVHPALPPLRELGSVATVIPPIPSFAASVPSVLDLRFHPREGVPPIPDAMPQPERKPSGQTDVILTGPAHHGIGRPAFVESPDGASNIPKAIDDAGSLVNFGLKEKARPALPPPAMGALPAVPDDLAPTGPLFPLSTEGRASDLLGIVSTLPISSLAPTEGPSHQPRLDVAPAPPVVQIVSAIVPGQDGTIEISLAPEELGRVRIDLRQDGDLTFVNVSAERGETLDLLRRHSDQLLQDFRAAGHASVSLSFGRWGGFGTSEGQGGSHAQPAPDAQAQAGQAPVRPSEVSSNSAPASGLYLRI